MSSYFLPAAFSEFELFYIWKLFTSQLTLYAVLVTWTPPPQRSTLNFACKKKIQSRLTHFSQIKIKVRSPILTIFPNNIEFIIHGSFQLSNFQTKEMLCVDTIRNVFDRLYERVVVLCHKI